MKKIRTLLILLVSSALAACSIAAYVGVELWPWVSMERELTGLDFSASLVFEHNPPRHNFGGDGYSLWVYAIPEDAARELESGRVDLTAYPRWCALSLEGYRLVRWRSADMLSGVERQAERLVPSRGAAMGDLKPTDVRTLDDARAYVSQLWGREGTLVSLWYKAHRFNGDSEEAVTDIYLDILNLQERVLVRIAINT